MRHKDDILSAFVRYRCHLTLGKLLAVNGGVEASPVPFRGHSPDGMWWWDGAAWVPAFSADGLHWWNGRSWVDVAWQRRRTRRFPRWMLWWWCVWLPTLVAWIPVLGLGDNFHHSHLEISPVAIAFGALAVTSTMVIGVLLGYRRFWSSISWSFGVGVTTLGLFILFAFESATPPAQDGPGTGIGAMFATACLCPVVALCLWLGGAGGSLMRRIRTRDRVVTE
jgi:hypothetical protein